MDSSYIIPFVEATTSVFETMVGLDVRIGKPHREDSMATTRHDVSAIIGLSGDLTGFVVLTFPVETASAVVESFTGSAVDPTTEAEDFGDAVGELVNMVAGSAKGRIEGMNVSISCPTVVIGSGHVVTQPSDAMCIRIPCDVDAGEFAVDICMKKAESEAVAPDNTRSAHAA